MTSYYRVIARGIAGLDHRTNDRRRDFYWRARRELDAQLGGLDPRPTQSEITRQRLGLDEAICEIEAELERLPQVEAPDTASTRPFEVQGSCMGRHEPMPDAPAPEPDSQSENKQQAGSSDTIGTQCDGPCLEQEQSQLTPIEVLNDFRQIVQGMDVGPHATKAARQYVSDFNSPKPLLSTAKSNEPCAILSAPELSRNEWRSEPCIERDETIMPAGGSTRRISLSPATPELRFADATPIERAGGSARAVIMAFLGLFIVLTVALTMYWQRDRLRVVFVSGPATLTQQVVQKQSPISYIVGGLPSLR